MNGSVDLGFKFNVDSFSKQHKIRRPTRLLSWAMSNCTQRFFFFFINFLIHTLQFAKQFKWISGNWYYYIFYHILRGVELCTKCNGGTVVTGRVEKRLPHGLWSCQPVVGVYGLWRAAVLPQCGSGEGSHWGGSS